MNMQLNGRWGRRTGFTLIEVIIVVAIIGFVVAIGVPSFIRARDTSQKDICRSNLRVIHAAVQRWALDTNQGPTAPVTMNDLLPYFSKNRTPVCPGGGNYVLTTVNDIPECELKSRGHDYE
jgi:prepilin-type N-terminal cleavage/methylation domain-containing protein